MAMGLDSLEPTDLDHRLRAAEAVVREAAGWLPTISPGASSLVSTARVRRTS